MNANFSWNCNCRLNRTQVLCLLSKLRSSLADGTILEILLDFASRPGVAKTKLLPNTQHELQCALAAQKDSCILGCIK